MEPLFPQLPDSLSALTDDELQALANTHVSTFAAIRANDPDLLGDRTATDILEQAKAGKDAYATIQSEQAARAEAEATYASEIASLTADIPELDTSDETDEAETLEADTAETGGEADVADETVEEAVQASAVRRPSLPQTRRHAPVVQPEREETSGPRMIPIVASAGIPGVEAGHALTELELGNAMTTAIRNTVASRAAEKVVIASARYRDAVPVERRLSDGDAIGNSRKLYAQVHRVETNPAEALTASAGQGNCAPLTPYYQFQNISTQARPVRDALVGFTADRGGITWVPPTTLADIESEGATGVITEADQALGGTFATKSCAVITCGDIQSQQVDQIYKCLQFGNLQSRAFPELVALDNNLSMAAHARLAETLLLDTIKAGSTRVHGADISTQGALNNYLGDLINAAAGIRSVNRMSDGAPLQAIAAAWVKDLLTLDLVRSQFMRWEYAQAQIEALLARYGILMTWTLDSSSNGGQVFPAQADVAEVNEFPTTIETAIFPPGSWLFLDAGVLDLGIVRDSVLNSVNAYQLFAETFEHAAKVGVVSYWLQSTLCPNGSVAEPNTTYTCS